MRSVVDVASKAACEARCSDESGCAVFSYNSASHLCVLFESCDTRVEHGNYDTYTFQQCPSDPLAFFEYVPHGTHDVEYVEQGFVHTLVEAYCMRLLRKHYEKKFSVSEITFLI